MEVKKIKLPFKLKRSVLALGSQSKNTVCFARGSSAFLSPVHPDLNRPSDLLGFEKTVKYFLKKQPKVIAHDLHPEYASTKYAHELRANSHEPRATSYELRAIQHHHAHIASCMADNKIKNQRVIGVAFDGTGLGEDSTLWGAEFFICDYNKFIRRAHLKDIPLLGGERAVLEPWRLAAAWLYCIYKDKFWDLGLAGIKKIGRRHWQVLKVMAIASVNSPLSSSMGRLFDAVGALVLEKEKINFEAELAIELEKMAMSQASCVMRQASGVRRYASYTFQIKKMKGSYIINPLPMLKELIKDIKAGVPRENISYRFHSAVAQMLNKTCLVLRKESGINKVVLSGGVFQNKLLLSLSSDLLYREGFEVFVHNQLSCSDSGISLGQAIIAGVGS